MAQDSDQSQDSELVEAEPIPLHKRKGKSWYINARSLCRKAGIEADEYVWIEAKELDPDSDEKVLTLVQIPDPSEDEIEREKVRKVYENSTGYGTNYRITMPQGSLAEVGVPLSNYNDDDPIMLRPLVDEKALYLIPLGPRSLVEDQDDAGEQRSLAARSPVDEDTVRQIASSMGVSAEDLGAALETLSGADIEDDIENLEDPVEVVDDRMRTVYFVDEGTVADLAMELGIADEIADAVRETHNRLAEQLLLDESPERAAFAAECDALVMAGPSKTES